MTYSGIGSSGEIPSGEKAKAFGGVMLTAAAVKVLGEKFPALKERADIAANALIDLASDIMALKTGV